MKIPRRTVLGGVMALPFACGNERNDENDGEENMALIDDSRPMILRASVSIAPNGATDVPAGALINSTGEPLEIHEFRFSLRPDYANLLSVGLQGLYPTGGSFAVGLSVADAHNNQHALTNGPVPIWSLGQARLLGAENQLQSFYADFINGLSSSYAFFSTAAHSWKLDHPMYVPVGGRIIPTVKSLGSFNGAVQLGISCIGKVLPNSPPSRPSYKVPWVVSYVSKSFDAAETGQDASTESMLKNPHRVPVTMERFIGRIHAQAGIISGSVLQLAVLDTNLLDGDDIHVYGGSAINYYSAMMTMRMRDSMGNPIVREKTPFRSVFEAATRSWECQHILPPDQFYQVEVFKDALPTLSSFPSTSRAQVSVTAVGWREVEWKGA